MCKDIVYVTFLVAVYIIPIGFCEPINTKTEIVLDRTPCHVANAEPTTETRYDITDQSFTSLARRSDELLYKINEIKREITDGGAIIENCVSSKFSHRNFSFSCKNRTSMTIQQMAECMVSSYTTVNHFSVSLKTIEKEKFTSESKNNLRGILKSIEDVEIYTDQLLCEIHMVLKQLGYNISFRQLSHENNGSIFSEYTEQAKKVDNNACFHVGSELSQIQIRHIIYQFLDTFSGVLQDMKDIFSGRQYTDVTQSDIKQSSTTTNAMTYSSTEARPMHDVSPIIIG